MWSQIVLFILVGFAYASDNPAWDNSREYVYQVRGRTLTGLYEVSDQYAGVLSRALLRVQPRGDSKLQMLLTGVEYGQVHSILTDGWNTEIPEEETAWKPLQTCSKPFQVELQNGKIYKLTVHKDCKNSDVNLIKSIVSLFQINTNGENTLPSPLNSLPDPESNSGVFLTKEDTVLGVTETLYKISPIPEHLLFNSEENARLVDFKLKQKLSGDMIEVTKHEEFSNDHELPTYVFGFGDYLLGNNPATNKMGNYFSRDSTSRAVLLGNLKQYNILHTRSVNTILVSPTVTEQQKGGVLSSIEAELQEIIPQNEKIEEISQPVEFNNLVYKYDNMNNLNKYSNRASYERFRSNKNGAQSEQSYIQYQPSLQEAPETPLYYTAGYSRMSNENSVNLPQEIQKLAKKIGKDLQDQEKDHHEQTLERYVKMVSLMRYLNADELKQLVNQILSSGSQEQNYGIYSVIRDAVAETGTGPAMLVIKDWIESGFIQGENASEVISAMTNSVHHPTEKYIKTLFELTKNQKVLTQWPLNDTILFSFSHLVRKVYVDKHISSSEYPVNYFGSFRTEEGQRFIKEEVIPYYSQMLEKSIQSADTHKIHAYIKTLGNIAEPQILKMFEPYLEGEKQCSQFQRLLMVVALEKLAETYPEEALPVFFRIYQNPAEHPAVRVAAVFQVMRSRPTYQILQLMASNTHIEVNEHVNAVVKSSIENLAELEGDKYVYIRESAKQVLHLLSQKKDYGLQYGAQYLRSYVIDELNILYKTEYNAIPSEDEYIPKGIMYTLSASLNDLHRKLVNVQAIVSSVDQLVDFTYKQTKSYEKQQKLRQQSSEQQENPLSSQNIAKLLNLKADEREQLEGHLYLELGSPYSMFSFDNNTIEQLPQYIRQLEQILKNGQSIRQVKLFNARELVIALPTVTGYQMMYTFDYPILLKTHGQVSATAQPQISSNDQIQKPNQIQIQSQLRFTVSGKTQGRLTIIAPSEHQQYISGYDKHWEVNIPDIESNINIDLNQQQVTAEVELKSDNTVNVLHYRTWPYTAKSDIWEFEPLSAQKNTKVIKPQNMQGFKYVVDKQYVGSAFEIEVNHERQYINMDIIRRVWSNNGILEGLSELWKDGYIQNSQFAVRYLPKESLPAKMILKSSYDQKYYQKPQPQGSPFQFDEKMEQNERQTQIMADVVAGISNARVESLDTVVQFVAEKNIQYVLTGAYAKSNVDPTSRVRVCFKRTSENSEIKDYVAHFVSKSNIKNTNGLNLKYTLDHEPKIDTGVELTFGYTGQTKSKITAQLKHLRSEERKKFLTSSPLYKQCQQQIQEGNEQSYTCTNMTIKANLLDHMEVKLHSEHLSSPLQNYIQMAYEAVRFYLLPYTEVKKASGENGAVSMDVKFHPDLEYVNISVITPEEETSFSNIEVYDIVRESLVAHPVFHMPSRLYSYYLGVDTYRDFCSVGKNYVNTFSNKTYDADLSENWAVMVIYVPKEARESKQQRPDQPLEIQLKKQLVNFVAYVRQNPKNNNQKDVKIVVSTPETDFEVFEIDLTTKQGSKRQVQVTVNGKKVELSTKESADFKNGYIQVYALPNGEVKVEVTNNVYILYDGQDIRLTAVNGIGKDSFRGLCGQFNDQQSEDFLVSEICMARSTEKFIKSFEIEGDEGKQIREQFAQGDKQCVKKEIPLYVDAITNRNSQRGHYNQQDECLLDQTRYVQENGQICFTTKTMPACRAGCRPQSLKKKTVGVHCLQQTKVAQLWKNQIDQGQSPDFSNKKQHKSVVMEVPDSCL
uniref:Vitellogenin n=1 Tax=Ophraella communa TaxID=38162 RepID=A0AA49K7M1_9CUCU|nr:vitellogenin [Ophraella communa]